MERAPTTPTNNTHTHTSRSDGSLGAWATDPLETNTLRFLRLKTTAMVQIPMNAKAFSRPIRPCRCKAEVHKPAVHYSGLPGAPCNPSFGEGRDCRGGSAGGDFFLERVRQTECHCTTRGEDSRTNANYAVIKARLAAFVASLGFGLLLHFIAAGEGRSRWSLPPTHTRRRFNRQLRTPALAARHHSSDRAQAAVPDGVAIARTRDLRV